MSASTFVINIQFRFALITLFVSLIACTNQSEPEDYSKTKSLNFYPSDSQTSMISDRDEEEDEDDDDDENRKNSKNKNGGSDDDELKKQPQPGQNAPPTLNNRLNTSLPLNIAIDKNPAENIVEVDLVAMQSMVEIKPGVFSQAYSYNGVVPGPMIHAQVGDTLIVNFTNNLPEPTTIHWHGVRLPADMDGGAVAQNPIQPGERFVYRFKLLDPALFWYHPHVRSNEQVEKGLAGTLLVQDPNELVELKNLTQDVMVLDDILLNSAGQIVDAFVGTVEEILLEKINGREGNTLLINGQHEPTFDVQINTPLRWRLVNVANSRFMRISIPNTTFTRIGSDGGLLPTPDRNLSDIFIVPGERADVVFTPSGAVGDIIPIYWNDTVRGRHTITIVDGNVMMGDEPTDGIQPAHPIAFMRLVRSTSTPSVFNPPAVLRNVPKINISSAKTAKFVFSHGMPMANGDIAFLINGMQYKDLTEADALTVNAGETYIWELVNMAGGDHPFHLHGFFFQVIDIVERDESGVELSRVVPGKTEDRDMVNLPRRPRGMGSNTTVRIAIEFVPGEGRSRQDIVAFGGTLATFNGDVNAGLRGHSGGWQFHCHILEHADTGMMSFVNLR